MQIFQFLLLACNSRHNRALLRLWAMLLALTVLSQTAQAGYWSVDHYNVLADGTGQQHIYKGTSNNNGNWSLWDDIKTFRSFWFTAYPWSQSVAGDQTVDVGIALSYTGTGFQEFGSFQMKKGKASCSATITPIFKWHPSGENDPPPASFLIVEHGQAQVRLAHDNYNSSYNEEHPYEGQNFSIDELSNGVETLEKNEDSFGKWHSYYDGTSYGQRFRNITTVINKSYARVINAGGRSEFEGPTATIGGTVSSQGWQIAQLGYGVGGQDAGASAIVWASYHVDIATATLRVRRMGATVLPPGQTETAPAPFSESANIAAGEKDSIEHKAEVQVSLWVPGASYYSNPEGFDVSQLPEIKAWPEGIQNKGEFSRSENAKTDANGTAVLGIWKSSDLNKPITLYLDGTSNVNPAHVNQEWLTENWKIENTYDYLGEKVYLSSDAEIPVSLKMRLSDYTPLPTFPMFSYPVPVTQHELKYIVTKVRVTGWHPTTSSYRTWEVVADANDILPGDDITELGDTGTYASFTPEEATGDQVGKYPSNLKIKKNDSWVVEKVWFKAQDKGVYQR